MDKKKKKDVYSLLYMRSVSGGNVRTLAFEIFVDKISLKRRVLEACDELVPGLGVVKVGMASVTDDQYSDMMEIFKQENGMARRIDE